MKVCVVGGGPGGLYAALLLKKSDPDRHVVLYEKNPPDATYGWGVVFSDRTLTSFREADYTTYLNITDRFVMWDAIDVRYKEAIVRCEGQLFSGISRKALLGLLQQRCSDLGVELRWNTEVDGATVASDFDLVVAADGVHSATRERLAKELRPSIEEGSSRYIWFGTDRTFDSFTFAFRPTEHGLFQAHAYPFDGTMGTFIVECRPETWRAAGLDRSSEDESIAFCEKTFRDDLHGRSLMSNNSKWLTFPTLKCRRWHSGNVVLVGDAVHTAHFSIGSGTKLAMEDSIALAKAFETKGTLAEALGDYQLDRRPRVEAFQEAARQSQSYFENTQRYMQMEPVQFAFHLLTRSGRIDYGSLRQGDPLFVSAVDSFLARGPRTVAPPPAFNPLELRRLRLSNRIVAVMPPLDSAVEGMPPPETARQMEDAARSGAALVVSDVVAASPGGRITSATPGIFTDDQAGSWEKIVQSIHQTSDATVALHLGHAGARGSTEPRHLGVDRPLGKGAWPLFAASDVRYTAGGQTPSEITRVEMDAVIDEFVGATRRVERAGFDVLGLHFGAGYLLASFLSPLTNKRTDDYGGSLEARAKFPLELFDKVRAAWPQEKPLFASLTVADWAPDGLELREGVEIARLLKEHGCDLLRVTAGQAVLSSKAHYDPYWLIHYSDVVRNEVGIPTMPQASASTVDLINTAIGAGRADLYALRALSAM